ncbi:MAG: hypothetical protein L6R40_008633 [Gallowayella cf. fulva]|nr:MAG: hypothetical protein L6R40_008633 [Xanthomendoza cf. fulva]
MGILSTADVSGSSYCHTTLKPLLQPDLHPFGESAGSRMLAALDQSLTIQSTPRLTVQSFSLDFFSRLWPFGWLRKASESPSLTSMDDQALLDVNVFPQEEVAGSKESDYSIRARSDKSLDFSIISTGMIARLQVSYTPCQQATVTDSQGVQHSPVGQVTLRWHKKEKMKSYDEKFFVVDSTNPIVILGATAFPVSNQSSDGNLYPVGVQKLSAEGKRAMDQKKLAHAQKSEKEKKEQEAKEAERRRQAK